jgi:hypothetical protein
MFNFDWNLPVWIVLLVLIAFVELVSVVIWGYLFCTLVESKHRNPSMLIRLFRYGEYTPQHDLNISGFRPIPRRYRFVIVEYQADNQVTSETYYTFLGDVARINYSNGEQSGSRRHYYSNQVLTVLPALGVSIYELSARLAVRAGEYNNILQQLATLGIVLICSTFLAGSIKSMLLDSLND